MSKRTWKDVRSEWNRKNINVVDPNKSVVIRDNTFEQKRTYQDVRSQWTGELPPIEKTRQEYKDGTRNRDTDSIKSINDLPHKQTIRELTKPKEQPRNNDPINEVPSYKKPGYTDFDSLVPSQYREAVKDYISRNPGAKISNEFEGLEKGSSFHSFKSILDEYEHINKEKPKKDWMPYDTPARIVGDSKDLSKETREYNPRETGIFGDRVKLKFQLGELMDQEGAAWNKAAATGNYDEAKAITQKVQDLYNQYPEIMEEVAPFSNNPVERVKALFQSAAESVANLAPTMINAQLKGAQKGALTSGAFMGAAAVGGQLGPQVLVPEEILTVPGAGIAGWAIGSKSGTAEHMYAVEKGQSFKSMVEMGVPEDIANSWSTVIGAANAGIELVQLDTLKGSTKAIKEVAEAVAQGELKDQLTDRGLKQILKYVKGVLSETGQEVLQETVSISGETAGAKQSGMDVALFTQENFNRLAETAIDSIKAFALMQGGGQVGGSAYRASKKGIQSYVNNIRGNTDVLSNPEIKYEYDRVLNEISKIAKETNDEFLLDAEKKLVDIQVNYFKRVGIDTDYALNKAENKPVEQQSIQEVKQVEKPQEVVKGIVKPIENNQDSVQDMVDNEQNFVNTTKFGMVEVVDSDGALVTIKNQSGTEFQVGQKAFEQMIIEDAADDAAEGVPDTNVEKADAKDSVKHPRISSDELTQEKSSLYREIGPDRLRSYFETGTYDSDYGSVNEIYVAKEVDYALGQGSNKGIMLVFDETGVPLKEVSKPGNALTGVAEYIVDDGGRDTSLNQKYLNSNLKKVIVSKDALSKDSEGLSQKDLVNRAALNSWLNMTNFEKMGWTKTVDSNGNIIIKKSAVKSVENKTDKVEKTQKKETQKKTNAVTEDFGEKIGGARKDEWIKSGLTLENLENMNDREIEKHLKKDNVWKKPDYNKMIADGMLTEVVYAIKRIRDAIPVKPYYPYKASPEVVKAIQKSFVETTREIATVLSEVKSAQDARNLAENYLVKNGYVTHSGGAYRGYTATEKGKNNEVISSVANLMVITDSKLNQYQRDAKKKQFGVSSDEKLPKGYEVRFNDDSKTGKAGDWEPNTYYVTRGYQIVKTNFKTKEEAVEWLKNAVSKASDGKTKKKFIPPQLENIKREGVDYRNNSNASGNDYIDTFGFKGGEFGNWMNETDRVASLNYGFDALMDLAAALGIDAQNIALNKTLSIAFGSRGQGGSGAVAHYEPDRRVINLTKMKGAGSLAHEWFHALDDYIGELFKLNGMATEKGRSKDLVSLEELISAMKKRPETQEEAENRVRKSNERFLRNAEVMFKNATMGMSDKLSESDVKKLNSIKESYLNGNEKSIDELSDLKKKATGYVIPKATRDDLHRYVHFLKQKDTKVETSNTKSDYLKGSEKMGEISHKDGSYWDSNIEMAARAFACYITDKTEGKSDYLSGHSELALAPYVNASGEMEIALAFPQGEERIRINKAFDNFFKELKEKGVLDNKDYNNKPTTKSDKKTESTQDQKTENLTMTDRNWSEVGKIRSIKAYQHEFPQVKPYFRELAEELYYDIRNTTKGEKVFHQGQDELTVTGQPRVTTPTMARIIDETGYSHADIEKAILDIINDQGSENHALAKKIEIIMDDVLVHGYTNFIGEKIPPNKGYIMVRNKIEDVKIPIPGLKTQDQSSDFNEQLTFGAVREDGETMSMFDYDASDAFMDMVLEQENKKKKEPINIYEGRTPDRQKPVGIVATKYDPVPMDQKFEFPPEIEEMRKKNRLTNKKISEKLAEFLDNLKKITTRTFREIDENDPFLAEARKELINYQKLKDLAGFNAVKTIEAITLKEYKELSSEEYNRYSRYILLRDLMEDYKEKRALPMPYSHDNIEVLYDQVKASLNDNIREAVKRRDLLLENVKNDYIKATGRIGFNTAGKFDKKNYFRHMVLAYQESGQSVSGGGRKVKGNANRGFLKQRQGTTLSINEDYLQAEFDTLFSMIYDTKVANMLGNIRDNYDITRRLKLEAKTKNKVAFNSIVEGQMNQIASSVPELKGETIVQSDYKRLKKEFGLISPLKEEEISYNQRIAINWGELNKLAQSDLWDGSGKWKSIVERLKNGEKINDTEDGSLFAYIAELAAEDGASGNLQARGILSAISKREQMYKRELGDAYHQWKNGVDRRLIPDGYDDFQPIEGKHMMMVKTVSEKYADALIQAAMANYELFSGLTEGDKKIREMLAVGGDRLTLIIPEEISMTLRNVYTDLTTDLTGLKKGVSKSLNMWKRWRLQLNPLTIPKYNIRNITGDLDGVIPTAGAGVVKYAKRSATEAWDAIKYGRFSKDFLEFHERGGLQSNFYFQEIADINKHKIFDRYKTKTALDYIATPFQNYADFVSDLGQHRETLLRYATYLYYKDTLKKNGGKLDYYGASNQNIVDGLKTIEDKAYQLSNDALGAYDQITEFGKMLRKYIAPFWSWNEVNFKRYKFIAINAAKATKFNEALGKKVALDMKIKLGAKGMTKLGLITFRVFLLSAALEAWNRLVMGDEDDKLPDSVKNTPHITLGYDSKTNRVIYFSKLGAITDLMEWFGLDTITNDIKEILADRKTIGDQLEDMAMSPVNKFINSFSPYIKSPIELVVGQSYFPDIREPRRIRDPYYYVSQTFGVESIYNHLAGIPMDKARANVLLNALVYTAEPESTAYYKILDLKRKYEKDVLNKPQTFAYSDSPKSEALYYMKLAMKYGDKEATRKYLLKYFENGGTIDGFERSISSMDPLYGLSNDDKLTFMSWLNKRELEELALAYKFYVESLSGK